MVLVGNMVVVVLVGVVGLERSRGIGREYSGGRVW